MARNEKSAKVAAVAAERVREKVGSATGVLLALEVLVPLVMELMRRCRKEPEDVREAPVPATVARMKPEKQRRFFERLGARRREMRRERFRTRADNALKRIGEQAVIDHVELDKYVSAYLRGADVDPDAKSPKPCRPVLGPAVSTAILEVAAYSEDEELDWLFEEDRDG